MEIGFDPAKNVRNILDRGLSFADVALLDWLTASVRQDVRKDYGEVRLQALVMGPDGKRYIVVYTQRGPVMWVISFRRANRRGRANRRESKSYGKEA